MALDLGCDGKNRGVPFSTGSEIGNAYWCGAWDNLSEWEIGSVEFVEWDAGYDPVLLLPEDPFEQNGGCDITTAAIAAGFVRFGADSDFLACYCWDEALVCSPETQLSKGRLCDGCWDESFAALSVYDEQDEVFESVSDMQQLPGTSCAETQLSKESLPDGCWDEAFSALPIYEAQGEFCESALDMGQLLETSCPETQLSKGGRPDGYWDETVSALPIYETQDMVFESVLDMRQLPETSCAETQLLSGVLPDGYWDETLSALPIFEAQCEVSDSVLDMGQLPETSYAETQLSKGGLPDGYWDETLSVLPKYEAQGEVFESVLDMGQLQTISPKTQLPKGGLPDGYWDETLSALSIHETQGEVSESVLDMGQFPETSCAETQLSAGGLHDDDWDETLSALPIYQARDRVFESVLDMRQLPENSCAEIRLSKGGLPDGYWDVTISALPICESQGEVSESVLDTRQLPETSCTGTNDLGDGLPPHDGFVFALRYLGVKDLLSVERVCKLLYSTVRNDCLLWRCIHIDSPLSDKITDDALLQLTQRAQGHLQCLSLINCSRITDEGLRHVLEKNPKLRKLSVPECVRLSIDGIISNLKAFHSAGMQGISCLKLGRLFSVSEEQFGELKILLGLGEDEQGKARTPLFYHLCRYSLTCDDEFSIDIDICPSCLKYKLVYDCPSTSCQAKGSQQCRACDVCIERCIQCGKCIKDSEYVETFFLDYLCSSCWENSPFGPEVS